MRAIILAAGEGVRLRPLTLDRPKCLVSLAGRTLLDWQLDALGAAGVNDITVVTGYRAEAIVAMGVTTVHNERFEETNMVASLMCARELLDGSDDVLVCYGDLVYEPRHITALAMATDSVAVMVDRQWLRLWSLRMENPLTDAETLKVSGSRIVEIGGVPRSVEEVEGQYMGLIGIKADRARALVAEYDRLDPEQEYGGRPRDRMFMTAFLQHLIDRDVPVGAVFCEGGWLEVDTIRDLTVYESRIASGTLSSYWTGHIGATPMLGRTGHQRLVRLFAAAIAAGPDPTTVTHQVARWLAHGPIKLPADQRRLLALACKEIDVKKRLLDVDGVPSSHAAAVAVSSVVAAGFITVLLLNAWDDTEELGWRLSCVNSAFNALDLFPGMPEAPTLRGWALEILDRATSRPATEDGL